MRNDVSHVDKANYKIVVLTLLDRRRKKTVLDLMAASILGNVSALNECNFDVLPSVHEN
jgi:hypothetical protein